MKKISGKLLFCILTLSLIWIGFAGAADHSFIEGPLNSGPEATKACLECHEDAAKDMMKTSHWSWNMEQVIDGKPIKRGKISAMNNFCVSVRSNEPRCTSCHVGYGWKDSSFDFTDESKVDCLVCHDTTGTYVKTSTGAGLPADDVDLLYVARNVGKSSRQNCGSCHFFGGGGDAVKHGDLDSSMDYPSKEIDVHMDTDGNDFSCASCHETTNHDIPGNAMVVSPKGEKHIGCIGCHGEDVHSESVLNQHTDTVACQTCHIPAFAKEIPTKTSWDWSTAGKDIKGEKDQYGKPTYVKKKGNFTWGKNITPEYAWYNGTAGAYQFGQKIDPTKVTALSYPNGKRSEMDAKIYPFKIHTGKQIYDTKNMYFITPKVYGGKGDKEAYWKNFNWVKAATAGMKASGLDFSGEFDFAPTIMYWRINHMVAPKEQALGCLECHGDNGRLDWAKLGYQGDPLKDTKYARTK
ncbi:MAG: tetrathionate reductase family octaheme c-type cytochrome [Deltaproteobacteria bacterium]|jgi:octaheme c-type cytochrome (tetrathionate reductase family)|nr:tetrathionate reductase family octaheme c-type cytochrome [Deltaproteobacteria bacterium]MCW9050255.1 tetrathionate reductase family octaheme c-type cytochrome [Deltaproteobacteria bacterium]